MTEIEKIDEQLNSLFSQSSHGRALIGKSQCYKQIGKALKQIDIIDKNIARLQKKKQKLQRKKFLSGVNEK